VKYLIVSDYSLKNIYQLKPDSGEVRAMSVNPCVPDAVVFDPSINGVYMTCMEDHEIRNLYSYRIRKKTFDGKIDEVIYTATLSTENIITHSVVGTLIRSTSL